MADVADDVVDPKDEVGGVAVLHSLTVDLGPQSEVTGVGHLVGGDDPGTDRREGVGALALRPLPAAFDLKFALGDVVYDAVTGDVLRRIVDCDISRGPTNDDAEFDLP